MNKSGMSKTIWITRTLPGAHESAAAFEQAGFKTVTAPLLTVENKAAAQAVPENAVLVFTSQNGVRAFCEAHSDIWETLRDCPVMTVGDATAALAKEMGFKNVRSAGGVSDDIAPLISRKPDKEALYIHISGQHVRGAAVQDIIDLGLNAERRIYYGSSAVQALPDIDIDKIDVAVFFSPMAAQTLARLSPAVAHMSALSISGAADEALGTLVFKERYIAKAPTLESLIAALRAAR